MYNDKAFKFTARNLGDWHDERAVIAGLNEALQDAGREERFMQLYTGDQTCLVTFAPEPAFRQTAAVLHLPLEDDQD